MSRRTKIRLMKVSEPRWPQGTWGPIGRVVKKWRARGVIASITMPLASLKGKFSKA